MGAGVPDGMAVEVEVGTVVGVVGARGGVGATTLAAALAQHLGGRQAGAGDARGAVALVDLDVVSAGLDVHLGIEDVDGVRWPDLSGARGEVPGEELTSLLPAWSDVPVLSGDRWRPGPAPAPVVADVLDALAGCHRTVVLDLGRAEVRDRGPGLRRCSTVLVVTPRDLRSVAGVVAVRETLRSTVPDVRLVLRGPGPGGLGALEVAHVVDLPLAGTLPRDRHLPARVERGLGPGLRGRGRLARAVRRLAGDLA
jgi:secretion/DNA translocation related CpaE-like protein